MPRNPKAEETAYFRREKKKELSAQRFLITNQLSFVLALFFFF
jgi:hypothetical protein